jgi:flagellar biosynthesis protein FliP
LALHPDDDDLLYRLTAHFISCASWVPEVPPNQVMIGITFLNPIYHEPVGLKINETAIKPYNEGKITEMRRNRLAEPIKEFMLRQTREKTRPFPAQ